MQVFVLQMCTVAMKEVIQAKPDKALKALLACRQCASQFFNPNDLIVKQASYWLDQKILPAVVKSPACSKFIHGFSDLSSKLKQPMTQSERIKQELGEELVG